MADQRPRNITLINGGMKMKKALCMALVTGLLCVAGANAATVTLTLVVDPGPGAYRIDATTDAPLGLALWGTDVTFTGAVPPGAMTPGASMTTFVRNNGLNNPAGYGGTVSGQTLLQVGGAQNTIANNAGNAPYPVGTVVTGLGYGTPVTVATGTGPGGVTVSMANCFANVITGPAVGGVYPVAAATVTCPNTIVLVSDNIPPTMTAAESRATHGSAGTFGVAINLTATGTNVANESRVFATTLPQTIRITFNEPVQAPGVGAVSIYRCTTGTTVVPTNVAMFGTSAWDVTLNSTGVNAPLPDVDHYRVTVAGVKDTAGNLLNTDANFEFRLLGGNPTVSPPVTKWLVNGNDVSQTQARLGQALTTANFMYDVLRAPPVTNGVINGNDVSGVQARNGHTITCTPP
jgi:hypothetical protein